MPGSFVASDEAGAPVKGATITQIKTGVLSPLQEEESCYYATTIIAITKDYLKLATSTWPKEPLESWLDRNRSQVSPTISAPTAGYVLPKLTDGTACVCDGARSAQPDTHAKPNCYGHRNTKTHGNSNCYGHRDFDTCAKSYSHTTGAPDSATPTVAAEELAFIARPAVAPYHSYLSFVFADAKIALHS